MQVGHANGSALRAPQPRPEPHNAESLPQPSGKARRDGQELLTQPSSRRGIDRFHQPIDTLTHVFQRGAHHPYRHSFSTPPGGLLLVLSEDHLTKWNRAKQLALGTKNLKPAIKA